MICGCGHELVLHDEDGVCVALIITLNTWSPGCGCLEFRQQTEKEKDK